ncbi:MAG: aminotransferase class V-fold PLP-dependent enzyme [Holophagales bacterium]|jgi:selenocysteine lyase/cysteine desulfurase|nr:aminotransferase class V-fold PLP-dependent enzyme [Holophagales bacterium]
MDWPSFRKRFPLPDDEIFLNTGTLGCTANSVIESLSNSQQRLASTIAHWEYLNDDREWITGYTKEQGLRIRLGRLFGAEPNEISLTQNATMGINFIASGMDWQQGDEVIQTDQEHPGSRCPWEMLAERKGIVVKHVHLPIPLQNPDEIIGAIEPAFTSRTKLLALPHITSGLGTILPIKELCALARSKGVCTLVDGAQVPGHIMLDIKDIGADAYSASLHKWLFAPAGNGFLHVKSEFAEKLWPTQASEAWKDPDTGFRLQQRGTGNPSLLHALDAALDIFEEIGPQTWCDRVKELGDKLRKGIVDAPKLSGGIKINSSLHPALCAGITSFELRGTSSPAVVRHLWDKYKIRIRDIGEPYGLRVSTAAYTQEGEITELLFRLAEL